MNGRVLKLIDGSANPDLVRSLALYDYMADSIANVKISSFSDGESEIEIKENMRGCDVFIIQPASPPANDHLVQLCLILDALKRSNCWRITAVMPYYPYGRQDKKLKPRVPISARAVADMIQAVGVDRILTMDLHSSQIQGFWNCPVDNLFASSIFLDHMRTYVDSSTVIVSPDVGGVARAVHYSKALGVDTAIIHKTRYKANEVGDMVLLGSVRDKTAIIIDDLVDSGGTLCKAAALLKDAGAKRIIAYASHGVFSGDACVKIHTSAFDTVYVTDSIQQSGAFQDKIKIISCAGLLSDAIMSIHKETSVSCLFK